MVPLFRRSPDPTIQWVRLDALEALYRGRHRNTVFMTPDEIREMLAGPPRKEKEPLYDRICRTNGLMARRMGLDAVEETLRGYARDAHSAYAQIIIEELEAV